MTAELLHPEDLRRLRGLVFTGRRAAAGLYAGKHVSARRSRGAEFADYRAWMPGDSPADIDWKTYARSDRLYMRLAEQQTDMTVRLVVDASASMGYGGEGPREEGNRGTSENARRASSPSAPRPLDPLTPSSKLTLASRIAAAIAFLCVQQRDQVCAAIAGGPTLNVGSAASAIAAPASTQTHLDAILDALQSTEAAGGSSQKGGVLPSAIDAITRVPPRGGLLVVLSDLLDEQAPILQAIGRHTHRGGEAILFHVLHADELRLPEGDDPAVFVDSENHQRLAADPATLRHEYEKRIDAFIRGWSNICSQQRVDHCLVTTQQPWHVALADYLHARSLKR